MKIQEEIDNTDAIRLQNLSRTRWTTRGSAGNVITSTHAELKATLKNMTEDKTNDVKCKAKARGLICRLESAQHMFNVFLMRDLAHILEMNSKNLQTKDLTAEEAIDCIRKLDIRLTSMRSDAKEFEKTNVPVKMTCAIDDAVCWVEATVVTGFESGAAEEVGEKLAITATAHRGKIRFQIPVSRTKDVLQLKSVDNVFVVIKEYEKFEFADTLEEIIQQLRGIIPESDWETGLAVWSQFFSFPHPVLASPVDTWKPVDDTPLKDTSPAQASSDCEMGDGDNQTDVAKPNGADAESSDINMHDESKDEKKTEASNENQTVDVSESQNTCDTVATDKSKCAGDASDGKNETKPTRKSTRPLDASKPSFRATCFRSGKHLFQSPQAAAHFGGHLQDYFGWNVNLSNYDIEVVLSVDNDKVAVWLALTKGSLHRRHIKHFGPTTLRPDIAYGMLRLCKIQVGEVVCDPMCGGGSIPIEGAVNWPEAVYLAGDNFTQAPPRTQENVLAVCENFLENNKKPIAVDTFRWDVCRLPFQDECVDVFITDMPFGKKSGHRVSNWLLYPQTLREVARVCRRNTGRACFLTHDTKCFTKTLYSIGGLWKKVSTTWINIGGLMASVYLLQRTDRLFLGKRDDSEQKAAAQ